MEVKPIFLLRRESKPEGPLELILVDPTARGFKRAGPARRSPERQADGVDSKALEGLRRGELVRVIRTVRDGSERRGSAGCPKSGPGGLRCLQSSSCPRLLSRRTL